MIKSKFLLIIAMIACYAMIFIDESGIAVTLPMMQQSLALTNNAVHWVINSYLLTLSVLLLVGGKLSDIFGHRRIFTLGIVIFIVASLICAFAQNASMIIGGRLLQGIGASLLMPCVMVIIHKGFPENEFGRALGLILGSSNFFYATGPFVAGALTEFINWRWFFLINIPVGIICLFFTFLSVAEESKKLDVRFTDTKGLIIFILALTSLITAIMQGGEWGWTNLGIVILFIFSVLGIALFIKVELGAQDPLLDVRLFLNKKFMAGDVVLFCSSICLTATVFWALWLQTSVGFSPATVGFALLPTTLTFMFVPALGGAWCDKSGVRPPMLTGTVLILIGIIWIAATLHLQSYAWLVFGLVVFGLGIPLAIPSSVTTVMSSVLPEQSGMASGTFTTTRQFALTFGIAILSAVITSTNNYHLSHYLSSSPDFAGITLHQINLLLTGKNTTQLDFSHLSLIQQTAKAIYTHALFYGMIVMGIFSVIACGFTLFYIKK